MLAISSSRPAETLFAGQGEYMDSDAFDAVMSSLDSPLVVVTTAADAPRELAGCLVGFHSQSSIEPQKYSIWLSKANHTYRVALRSTHLAIHFLTPLDLSLAELFGTRTGDTVDKFAGLQYEPGPGGAPRLALCPSQLIARRTVLLDEGGDHVCFVVEPVIAQVSDSFRPLRLSMATQLVPGHASEERPGPATERAG